MPKRHNRSRDYVDRISIVNPPTKPDMIKVAMKVPAIVDFFDVSIVKQKQLKPDWSKYRVEERDNTPYIVREMCDRCGKVWIAPKWRKLRVFHDAELGDIYFEAGVCKDCINASVYVDGYLDGDPLTEKEAKELFYKYAEEYEKAWRMVIAVSPKVVMTEHEWQHRCKFFNGCAVCGGPIEVRAKYFPATLNGYHTAWNVIPLCKDCIKRHYTGRNNPNKTVWRYRVFSTHEFFNKSKTIRLYLIQQMRLHNIYMDPILPYMQRFRETKVLEGAD